jgi:hypothetical protein
LKTSSRKAKGRKLQQWARDKILEIFPRLKPADVLSTSMGANGEDLLLSTAARRKLPLSFECKNLAKFVGYTYMKQAEANAPKNTQPVVIIKANREQPLAIIDAEYFLRLYERN